MRVNIHPQRDRAALREHSAVHVETETLLINNEPSNADRMELAHIMSFFSSLLQYMTEWNSIKNQAAARSRDRVDLPTGVPHRGHMMTTEPSLPADESMRCSLKLRIQSGKLTLR